MTYLICAFRQCAKLNFAFTLSLRHMRQWWQVSLRFLIGDLQRLCTDLDIPSCLAWIQWPLWPHTRSGVSRIFSEHIVRAAQRIAAAERAALCSAA